MTTGSKPAHAETTPSAIRLSVWLLVLVLGVIIVVAIALRRPGGTQAPKQGAQARRDTAGQDAPASPQWNAALRAGKGEAAMAEPVQKTLAGWVLDLQSTNAEVSEAARQALKELGPQAAPAIPQLVPLLNDPWTCNRAAWALVGIGTNALPALIKALTNGTKYARLEVAGAIGVPWFREAGEAIVPGLVECLKYDDPGVRGNAIAALQAIPKRPDIAVPALIAALADPEPAVRDSAARVLEKYGQVEADATLPLLVQAAGQEQNPVNIRFTAAELLRTIARNRATAEGF